MKPQRRTGDEPFIGHTETPSFTLRDFWAWSSSDVLSNRMRGIVAEFIVAQALGVAEKNYRIEWDSYDVLSSNRIRIEVKSAAYCQAWHQKRLSPISFSIRPSLSCDNPTGEYSTGPTLNSEVYVFALLHNQDKETINVLDLTHWEFYVVPTSVIQEKFAGRKSINLGGLRTLGAEAVGYDGLRVAIEFAQALPTTPDDDATSLV